MESALLIQIVDEVLSESFGYLRGHSLDDARQDAMVFVLEQSEESADAKGIKSALLKYLQQQLGKQNGHDRKKLAAGEDNGDGDNGNNETSDPVESFLTWLKGHDPNSESSAIAEANEDSSKGKERALYVALRDLVRLTLFCLPSQVEAFRLRAIFELWLYGFNYEQIAERCQQFVESKTIVRDNIRRIIGLAQANWNQLIVLLDATRTDLGPLLEAANALRKVLRKRSQEAHPGGTRAMSKADQHEYEACKWVISFGLRERRKSSIFSVSTENLGKTPLEMLFMRMRSEAHGFIFEEPLRPKKTENRNLMAKFASAFLQLAQFSILCMQRAGNSERRLVFGYRDWAIFRLHMREFSSREIAERLTPRTKKALLKALKPSTITERIRNIRTTIFAILGEDIVRSIAKRGERFDLSEGIRRVQEDATNAQRQYQDLFPGGQRSLSAQAKNDIAWLYSRVDLEGVKAQHVRARAKMTPAEKLAKSRLDEQRRRKKLAANSEFARQQRARRNAADRRRLRNPKKRAVQRRINRDWQRERLAKLKKSPAAHQAHLQRRRELRATRQKKG